jgi:membrane-associated phospholipid phosphatase
LARLLLKFVRVEAEMKTLPSAALILLILQARIAVAEKSAPSSQPESVASSEPESQAASQPSSAETIRETAKRAELIPIVPSPKDITKPAFQLYVQTDLPILGIGLVLGAARFIRTQPAFCAPLCNKNTLNVLDRTTAGFYDANWSTASDVGLFSIIGLSAGLLLIDEGILPALNDAVVIGESALSATGLASLATLASGRPRPFLYGTKAPLALRNGSDASLSFLSSHAAVSFSVATSTFMTMRRLHPGPRTVVPLVVVLVGVGASTFVATARVMAGYHFITDAIGGAIIGSAVGILVPALHESPVKVVPNVTHQGASLEASVVF